MDASIERPLTREQLIDLYESLLGQITGLEARKNPLKAPLKEAQEEQKAIKAPFREVCWQLDGASRVHCHFDSLEPDPASGAIEVEAERIAV
jgi:hypothetical protein